MAFWKIAVWKGQEGLRSIALLADQRAVLDKLTQGMPESYEDEDELARVSEFVSTVEEIESLTNLRFDSQVREADIRRAEAGRESMLDFRFPA